MRQLIEILVIVCDFIHSLINRRNIEKRDDDIAAIRKDPAGEFIDEFGGVRASDAKAGVSGDQAGVDVINKE